MSDTYWKDSMIGETHKQFQKKFYSKQELRDYKKKHGFVEVGEPSKAHIKRVTDFVNYCKDEKKRNPNWKYNGNYPS